MRYRRSGTHPGACSREADDRGDNVDCAPASPGRSPEPGHRRIDECDISAIQREVPLVQPIIRDQRVTADPSLPKRRKRRATRENGWAEDLSTSVTRASPDGPEVVELMFGTGSLRRREDIVTQPAVGRAGNVVPFRRSHRPRRDQSRTPGWEMADALRSFDLIERCAVALRSCPLSIASEGDGAELPIVSFQAQLPIIERWLDHLARINVANWPDTRWVLRLNDARSTAALRLQAVMRGLHRDPPGPGPLNSQLAADIRKFVDALHKLRQLIAQQFPESLRVP